MASLPRQPYSRRRTGAGGAVGIRRTVLAAALSALALVFSLAVSATPAANAELLNPRQEWLRDSHIGLFLHWGMFTAPIHTDCEEWEQAVTDGGWTADYWVDEAQKLHASYIVLATFHSRLGYARPWPSDIPGSCSTQRDFLGELVDAAKSEGIKVILYMTDDPQWHDEKGVETLDSAAYSAYKGHDVDLTTRDGFGEYSYDLFFEVMERYPELSGFWIDNDNAYWERHDLYQKIRELRPSWTLSNNNEDTPIMDMVSHEQKTGMTPAYDYPQAVWTPQPRLTEGEWKLPDGGQWWYDGGDRNVNYPLNVGRVIANAGSSIKSLIDETAMVNGKFPSKQAAFNNFMDGYLDEIWPAIHRTEGGGYMYGGMQPGFWNDGAHGVITVDKDDPNLEYVHVITPPQSQDFVRLRDNGYKVTGVTNLRTGERMTFSQSGGSLTIRGIDEWDTYDTVFRVETDGQQFYYPQDSITSTATASAAGHPASGLTDGSYLDYWDADRTVPVSIDLDLGDRNVATHLAINQREWSPTHNRQTFGRAEDSSRIKDYRVYVSDDGEHWGEPVKTGTMPSHRGIQFIDFGRLMTRHIRLQVLSTWGAPEVTSYYNKLAIDEMYVGHGYPFRAADPLPYEAESGANELTGTAKATNCEACSGSSQVVGLGGGPDNSVTFPGVQAEQAGDYRLDVYYTADGAGSLSISVNGAEPKKIPVEGESGEVPEVTPIGVPLEAGANRITVFSDDAAGPGLDRIDIRDLPPTDYSPKSALSVEPASVWVRPGEQSFDVSAHFRLDDPDPIDDVTLAPVAPEGWTVSGDPATADRMTTGQSLDGQWTVTASTAPEDGSIELPVRANFEFLGRSYTSEQVVHVQVLPPGWVFIGEGEHAALHGSARADGCGQCSNGEKVRFIGNSTNNYATFENVTVDQAGDYPLLIDNTVNGSRSFWISVNGGPGIEVPVTGTSWDVPNTVTTSIHLDAGTNAIKVYNDDDNAPDLDRIRIADPNG